VSGWKGEGLKPCRMGKEDHKKTGSPKRVAGGVKEVKKGDGKEKEETVSVVLSEEGERTLSNKKQGERRKLQLFIPAWRQAPRFSYRDGSTKPWSQAVVKGRTGRYEKPRKRVASW